MAIIFDKVDLTDANVDESNTKFCGQHSTYTVHLTYW